MPWSEKAQGLLFSQYAPTGNAGVHALSAAVQMLEQASEFAENSQQEILQNLSETYRSRLNYVHQYIHAYQEYCWTVKTLDD